MAWKNTSEKRNPQSLNKLSNAFITIVCDTYNIQILQSFTFLETEIRYIK